MRKLNDQEQLVVRKLIRGFARVVVYVGRAIKNGPGLSERTDSNLAGIDGGIDEILDGIEDLP
jgi:hypothetical protein